MIKAIIFDCFGVLCGNGFSETYVLAGGDPAKDAEFINYVLNAANRGLISSQEMSQQITYKLNISYETWREAVHTSEQVNGALLEYIKTLKSSYRVAILSNANIGTLQRKFTPDQLAIFDEVVVSAEVGMIKPDVEIYQHTAQKLGVKTEECIFIDDNVSFCEGAVQASMKTILYRDIKQFIGDITPLLSHG